MLDSGPEGVFEYFGEDVLQVDGHVASPKVRLSTGEDDERTYGNVASTTPSTIIVGLVPKVA